MLTILRQNKESLIIKIILGIIILSFAAFFGVSAMQPGGDPVQTPAIVNGENINPARYEYYLENQMEQLKEAFKDNIPPEYLSGAKRSVVNVLINQKLLQQELENYGLRVSSDELAESIKTNQQFYRDGKFDFYYYQNRFLPGYRLQTGDSYESDTMRELLTQKVFDQFEDIIAPAQSELDLQNKIYNTKFKFSVVKIFTKDIEENETVKNEDANKDKNKLSPLEKAQKIYTDWKAGKDIKPLLDEYKLTVSEMPEINYTKIKAVFGGKGDIVHLNKLIKLTKETPFPDEPIHEGNYYYIVKLDELIKPDAIEVAEDTDTTKNLEESYTNDITSNLESAFIRDLRGKSEIKIFE